MNWLKKLFKDIEVETGFKAGTLSDFQISSFEED